MKIAHYINNLGSGGAERQLVDYLPLLKEQGVSVKLIVSNNKKSVPRYLQELEERGIDVIDLHSSAYSPFQIFKLINLIRGEKFDIIHAHIFPSQYWLAISSLFFSTKVKLVKTEHSASNNRRNKFGLKFIEKFVYSRFNKIIGITNDVTQNLRLWIDADEKKIVTIPNGVILNKTPINKNFKDLFPPNSYKILMVARLDQNIKNPQELILSLTHLPKDVHLFFAGEGPDKDNLKLLAQNNNVDGQVHFLGMRTDVRSLMDSVDLNILLSWGEGMSGVALESMASRNPFIGSNVSGINNIVPNDSFLYNNGNPEMLAKMILKMRNASKVHIDNLVSLGNIQAQKFDINVVVQNYIEFYNKIRNNNNFS